MIAIKSRINTIGIIREVNSGIIGDLPSYDIIKTLPASVKELLS
jgi:hypothetical protein